MDINRGNIEDLFTSYETSFTEAHQAGMEQTIALNLAMRMPSVTSTTVHTWLKQLPFMREWVGDRFFKKYESEQLIIKNKKYESSVDVPRDDIEDDLWGLYTPIIRAMGNNAAMLWEDLLAETLVTNDNWADGLAFYSTTRDFGGGVVNNKSTAALSETEFDTAYNAMLAYVGKEGKGLNVVPFALLCGPKNRKVAWNIIKAGIAPAATGGGTSHVTGDNANQDIVSLFVSNRLVGANEDKWFLLGRAAGLEGTVIQVRSDIETQSVTDSGVDSVFDRDEFKFGVRARGTAFKALPQAVYGGGFA